MNSKKLANNRSPRWAFMEKFIIPDYDTDGIYLVRWRIIQTPLFGIYLHKINTPDPRDTLHDHPYNFVSVILRGGYIEYTVKPKEYSLWSYIVSRTQLHTVTRVNIKRATDLHYIHRLLRVPTWTLMFVGRRQREWGFVDHNGWTRHDLHPHNGEFNAALKRLEERAGKN